MNLQSSRALEPQNESESVRRKVETRANNNFRMRDPYTWYCSIRGRTFLTVHEMGPLRVPLNRRHTSSEKKRILDDAFWLEKKVSKTSRQMARNALFTKIREKQLCIVTLSKRVNLEKEKTNNSLKRIKLRKKTIEP